MRTLYLLMLCALVACEGSVGETKDAGGEPADAGPAVDAGNTADAGDAGGELDAGPQSDAGSIDAGPMAPPQTDRCADAGAQAALPTPLRTFSVDSTLGLDTNDGGSASPWKTLTRANNAAQPGDLFLVRGSFTQEYIRPAVSGTASNPIVYRGVGRPVISAAQYGVAVWITARAYVVVDGFELTGNMQPVDLLDSQHCTLRNNFIHDTGYMRVIDSSDNVFEDNQWPQCATWCVFLTGGSNRNRFERNLFGRASSIAVLLQASAPAASDDNVIAHNLLANTDEGALLLAGLVRRTTIACNEIRGGGTTLDAGASPAITLSSSDNVLYANLVWNNLAEPLRLHAIGDRNADRNRIEHNVFYGNDGPGLRFLVSTAGQTVEDNLVEHNILWGNNRSTDFHWTHSGEGYEVVFDTYHTSTNGWPDGGLGGNVIRDNLIGTQDSTRDGGWLYFIGYTRNLEVNLEQAQARWPGISANLESDPRFWNPDAGDFRLGSASPATGLGRFQP